MVPTFDAINLITVRVLAGADRSHGRLLLETIFSAGAREMRCINKTNQMQPQTGLWLWSPRTVTVLPELQCRAHGSDRETRTSSVMSMRDAEMIITRSTRVPLCN